MTRAEPTVRPGSPLAGLKIWHLAALVVFVAVAIANIQDHRQADPTLIALASAGFAVYGLVGWLGWRSARRFEARVGPVAMLGLYLAAMAAFFLVATVAYLVIERIHLVGHL